MNAHEWDAWIDEWRREAMSSADLRRFEDLLRASPEARKRFLKLANLDNDLREWAAGRDAVPPWPAPVSLSRQPARWLPAGAWHWAAAAAGIALLCVGSFWWGVRRTGSGQVATRVESPMNQGCALLTRTAGAEWDTSNSGAAPGEVIAPGVLRLSAGMAQIEFFSGATVIMEAPCELKIVSAWEAECPAGALRLRVPPAARGFRLRSGDLDLKDLGTEFGFRAGRNGTRVHVFEGEVELQPAKSGKVVHLRQGESWGNAEGATNASGFPELNRVTELAAERAEARFAAWQADIERRRQDPRLIAFYTFNHDPQWDRLVRNMTIPRNPDHAGGVVGAAWTPGRWPQKGALEFKRPGDRVRLQLEGTYQAITLACWVKVDGLDRTYNALLLTDGYESGEPHWQIYEDGRLMFSIAYEDPAKPIRKRNQIYYSPPIFTPASVGRWHHLAVTYDNASGAVVQYLDGREISREVSPFHETGRPVVFGRCEIGNWGLPTEGQQFPLCNFNGRIDEFSIHSTALSPEEIHDLYESGKPL